MITAVGKYIYKCHSERREVRLLEVEESSYIRNVEDPSTHPDVHRGSVGMTI